MSSSSGHHQRSGTARLSATLIVSLLFITLSSLGYATVSDSVTTTFSLHSAKLDPYITNYWIIDYYGYGFDITLSPDNKTLIFTDDLLFPGWYLKLLIEIKNDANVAVSLNYTIEYLNGNGWITTNKTGLLDLFRIIYEDGFYLDRDCSNPIDTQNYTLGIGEVVYKKENLYFDAQDHPELQDQEFIFHVIIEFTGDC